MNRRILLLIGLIFELLAIFGLFLPNISLLTNGTEITLRTVPVDPRSILRGDYVVLGYEIGQNVPAPTDYDTTERMVYAILEKRGDVYERVGKSYERPVLQPDQVCIRGVERWGRIDYPDIAQYFVSEGEGHVFEEARNAHRLLVDAAVSTRCTAIIKAVKLGPEVPPEQLTDEELKMRGEVTFPPVEEPQPQPQR